MRKITLLFLTLLLVTVGALHGCSDSNGSNNSDFVYTGTDNGGNGAVPVQTNDILLRVVVDSTVPGAQLVAYEVNSDRGVALLKLVSSPAAAQSGNFTLPGATVTALDSSGQFVGTSTVAADGTVLFEDLPTGAYRFVVTTSDPAVVLEAIAISDGSTIATRIDVESTVATLLTLRRGNGGLDPLVYQAAVNATRSGSSESASQAVAFINASLQSSTSYLGSNGTSISSPQLATLVNAAAAALIINGVPGNPGTVPPTTTNSTGTTGGDANTGTTGGDANTGTTGGMTNTGTTGGATMGTTGSGTIPGGTTGGGATNGTTGSGTIPGGTTGGGSTSGTTGGGTIPGGTTGGSSSNGTTGSGTIPGGTTGGTSP